MPTLASANSGTITKLVQGCSRRRRCWGRSRTRGRVVPSAASSGGLLAERARPLGHPLEIGARGRVRGRDEPDREAGDHRVDARLVSATQMATPTTAVGRPRQHRRVASASRREQRGGDGERNGRRLRVHGGDHQQRDQVVDDHEREQADAQPRPPGATSASTPSANAVSVDIAAPQPVRTVAAGVEREVDQDRDRHAAECGASAAARCAGARAAAHVELALGLEPEDQEEERHQALVDPLAQVRARSRVAEADRERRWSRPTRRIRPRRVRPQQRGDRGAESTTRRRSRC